MEPKVGQVWRGNNSKALLSVTKQLNHAAWEVVYLEKGPAIVKGHTEQYGIDSFSLFYYISDSIESPIVKNLLNNVPVSEVIPPKTTTMNKKYINGIELKVGQKWQFRPGCNPKNNLHVFTITDISDENYLSGTPAYIGDIGSIGHWGYKGNENPAWEYKLLQEASAVALNGLAAIDQCIVCGGLWKMYLDKSYSVISDVPFLKCCDNAVMKLRRIWPLPQPVVDEEPLTRLELIE